MSTPRQFEADAVMWIAALSGGSSYGTGHYGLAPLEAVHFAHAEAPETPLYEALLARGRFEHLHDEELTVLLRSATPVVARGG